MNRRLILALLVTAPFLCRVAAASLEDAQAQLKTAITQVIALADKASSKSALLSSISPILERQISFGTMTRRAVGPGWRQFNADQQKRATALFSKLVIRSYSDKFTLGEHPEVKFHNATTPAAGRVDVTTTTLYQGDRYSVIYRLEQEEGWRTTDVVIEGVSMVANYRSQLDPVFKKGGVDAVLRSLETSAAR